MIESQPTPTVLAGAYSIVLEPNVHGGYYARIPAFPTVFTGGLTREEALANAVEALEVTIEDILRCGDPLPCEQPASAATA